MRARRAGAERAEALAQLLARSLPEAWSADAVRSALSQRGGRLLVLEDADGALVGALLLRVEAGEAEVLQVAVEPSRRRRGAGRRLLIAGEAAAIEGGAGRCFLEVRAGNRAARALYFAAGYREVGRRVGYYRDGEDALVLERDLDPGPPVSP